MIRWGIALCILSFCLSCKQANKEGQKENANEIEQEKTEFKMYEMSEMAALMEQMFVDNQRIREKITEGITIETTMPSLHQRLYTATLTDPSDKDLFFETQARNFIRVEEEFYADPNENTKEKFNAIVEACLSCHQKKCGGPIPRIKRLLIP